jgi:hypothetical protein
MHTSQQQVIFAYLHYYNYSFIPFSNALMPMLVVNNYTVAIVMEKKVNKNQDGDWDPFLSPSMSIATSSPLFFSAIKSYPCYPTSVTLVVTLL